MLAEPAVELPVVPAVHIAVPVEIEVPQIADFTGACLERGSEKVAVELIHVPVAVTVAEQPEEAVLPVAAGRAVPIAVELPAPTVVDAIREDRQGVGAGRQGAADELRAGKGEHRHSLNSDRRDVDLEVDQAAILSAQLDGRGVEECHATESDGKAVDHGAMGGAVVDHD